MNIETVTFPPGGFATDRIIYAMLFADGSAYVGITGTSNQTGTSAPLKRLATHIHKRGNTYSVLDTRKELANRGFRFCYTVLQGHVAPYACAIEQRVCRLLHAAGVEVLNGNWEAASWPVENQEEAVECCANDFATSLKERLGILPAH